MVTPRLRENRCHAGNSPRRTGRNRRGHTLCYSSDMTQTTHQTISVRMDDETGELLAELMEALNDMQQANGLARDWTLTRAVRQAIRTAHGVLGA